VHLMPDTGSATANQQIPGAHLMPDTGSATANQESQLGGWPSMDIRSMAKMFWGDEMGLVMPPMLEARATPITCVAMQASKQGRTGG